MRIVFNIRVGIDVPSYVQAGEKLDQLKHALEVILEDKGEFDIENFQAHHRHIRKYADQGQDMEAQRPLMAQRGPEPDRY